MTPGGIVTGGLENLIKDVGMYETQQSLEDFLPNGSFPQRKGRYAVVNETGTYWTFDGNIWKDTGIMVNKIPGFQIPDFDDIELVYTGSDMTGVIYKKLGDIVYQLSLTYTSGNLTRVTKV